MKELELQATESGVLVVRTRLCRLDAVVASAFRAAMLERVSGAKRVVIDLTSVTFLDSAGLGALVAIQKALPDGADLVLVGVQTRVRSLLQLTRLERLFPSADSVAAAVTSSVAS